MEAISIFIGISVVMVVDAICLSIARLTAFGDVAAN